LVAGCGGGDKSWKGYNADREGFDDAALETAAGYAEQLVDAGLTCENFGPLGFGYVAGQYNPAGIPLPLGAGSCVGDNDEDIEIDVFSADDRPTADDFVDVLREKVCGHAKEDGTLDDPASTFALPNVLTEGGSVVIRPDTVETAEKIAAAIGGDGRDLCEDFE
jgi:hypothetical protein